MNTVLKGELNFQGLYVTSCASTWTVLILSSILVGSAHLCARETLLLIVQSDYGATHSTIPSALAGMDMELPSVEFCEYRYLIYGHTNRHG